MDFEINGDTYFVNLAEGRRGWQVLVSTPNGARSIPVYDDAVDVEEEDLAIVIEDERKRRIVN